jgi:protoporphyrinogen oxidase
MSGFLVIGAGPTGLGAVERLRQRGHDDVVLLEATGVVGGLARSCTDEAGFTYDIGGHVLFSHYEWYNRLVDELLGDSYREIQREAWVWMEGRFIPYPFQENIRELHPETVYACLRGLVEAQRTSHNPVTFHDWIHAMFGDGMARHFMLPYNWKVWATPPERMAFGWIAERVRIVDIDRVLRNVVLGEDHVSWGPNRTFRFPLRGGTGYLWQRLADRVASRIRLDCPVVAVDPVGHHVTTADGRRWRYDALLSTMPLDELIACCRDAPGEIRQAATQLQVSGTHVVAVALDRPAQTSKNWIYYPEPAVPFYRVTYLSNYSPYLTPQPDQTILLTETSTSPYKPEDPTKIVDRVLIGLRQVGLVREDDRIVTTWRCSVSKSYPVPTLGRDEALATIEPWLDAYDITSRGRFGAWRYEIGNMDHSCMQGVEWADRMLDGTPERVWQPVAGC